MKEEITVIDILRKSGDLERIRNRLLNLTGEKPFVFLVALDEKKRGPFYLFTFLEEKAKAEGVDLKINPQFKDDIFSQFLKAHRYRKLVKFSSPDFQEFLIFPLIHGGMVYGFLGIILNHKKIDKFYEEIISDFCNIFLEKAIKEIELIRLHNTIRPRAIALSTVHTVHRLISSTLNIEELLPRLARLCLQVLRAKYCSIYIKEDGKLMKKATASVGKEGVNKSVETRLVKKSQVGQIIRSARYLSVPLIEEDVIGVIFLKEKQNQKPFDYSDQEILSVMAEQAIVAIRNARLHEGQGRLLWESIRLLSRALDVRSPNIYTHPIGFVDIVMEIATEYGLEEDEKKNLRYAAILLDAGKLAIPEEILTKPHKLTKEEYQSIKEHPEKSAEIVRSIKELEPIIPIILYHHERYDGKGYPEGLKKDEIPIGARIVAVADAFEAMICKRPYRGSISFEAALKEIKKLSGKQFDPQVVKAFLRAVEKGKIKEIACQMREEIEKER